MEFNEHDPVFRFGRASGKMLGALASIQDEKDPETRKLILKKMTNALYEIITLVDSYAQDEGLKITINTKEN